MLVAGALAQALLPALNQRLPSKLRLAYSFAFSTLPHPHQNAASLVARDLDLPATAAVRAGLRNHAKHQLPQTSLTAMLLGRCATLLKASKLPVGVLNGRA